MVITHGLSITSSGNRKRFKYSKDNRKSYGIKAHQGRDPLFSSYEDEDFLTRADEQDLNRLKSLDLGAPEHSS